MAYRIMARDGKRRHVNSGHGHRTAEELEIVHAHIRRAYTWNYTDGEIALYADCSSKTVLRWRQAHSLPSNYEGLVGIR